MADAGRRPAPDGPARSSSRRSGSTGRSTGDIEVAEVHTPLLEGYAGVFYTSEDRIEISEDLDELTIIHEASHAWFNSDLFVGRWINEGFADEYASRVLDEVSRRRTPARTRSSPTSDGAVDLNALGASRPDRRRRDERPRALRLRGLVDGDPGAGRRDRRGVDADGARPRRTPTRPPTSGRRTPETVDASERLAAVPRPARGGRRRRRTADDAVPALGRRRRSRSRCSTPGPRPGPRTPRCSRRAKGWLPGYVVRDPMGRWDFGRGHDRDRRGDRRSSRSRDQIAARPRALGVAPPALAARRRTRARPRTSTAVRDAGRRAARDGHGARRGADRRRRRAGPRSRRSG